MEKKDLTRALKTEAFRLGFSALGIAPPGDMAHEYEAMRQWLKDGMHGEMTYLEKALEKRKNPLSVLPSAKSVIVTLTNYFPPKLQSPDTFQVAKYAYGKDYHPIIKNRLGELQNYLEHIYGVVHAKRLVDSSPVFEKAWAQRAGLGWVGKNSLLINKEYGSFCFIGILMIDIELEYDSPITKSGCETCSRCIQACPAQAIVKPGTIDARKCISYLTIESKNPSSDKEKQHQIYGCDLCQDACPWNKKNPISATFDFHPCDKFLALTKTDWQNMTQQQYDDLFQDSAIQRAGYSKLKSNIKSLSK